VSAAVYLLHYCTSSQRDTHRRVLAPGAGDGRFDALLSAPMHVYTYNQGMSRVVQAQLARATAASSKVSVLVWHEMPRGAIFENDANWKLRAENILCCLRYYGGDWKLGRKKWKAEALEDDEDGNEIEGILDEPTRQCVFMKVV
jgi:hypothetical protein